jgi:hypothetical protein
LRLWLEDEVALDTKLEELSAVLSVESAAEDMGSCELKAVDEDKTELESCSGDKGFSLLSQAVMTDPKTKKAQHSAKMLGFRDRLLAWRIPKAQDVFDMAAPKFEHPKVMWIVAKRASLGLDSFVTSLDPFANSEKSNRNA